MKMTMGDFLDRWTILRMKARADLGARTEWLQYESEMFLLAGSERWQEHKATMIELISRLVEANAKIWLLEAEMRHDNRGSADVDSLAMAEYGRKALEIRDHNKLRVSAKNEINKIFGDAQDKKVEHASQ
jgi:hypothetical protein